MDELKSYLLPQGTVLCGRYRIERLLGEGGFGITYYGTEINLGLPVAIKEYYPYGHALRDSDISLVVYPKPNEKSRCLFAGNKEKFLDEARVLAQCEHIHSVVGVREYFDENQTAYIVMEYLDGITLRSYCKSQGNVNPEWLCRLMLPLIQDIAAIHQQGFLHRDISPDNIMLVDGRTFRLLDFGAAREFEADGRRSMTVMLKHGFAPYEQYTRHGKQGPWTDVYALCATLYASITSIVPDNATDAVGAIVIIEPKPSSAGELDTYPTAEQMKSVAHMVKHFKGSVELVIQHCFSPLLAFSCENKLWGNTNQGRYKGCTAGICSFSIDVDGNFTPCRHLGDVEKWESLHEYWENSPVLQKIRHAQSEEKEPCVSCYLMKYCRRCITLGDELEEYAQCPLYARRSSR